jgi:hypothetical protein
VQFQIFCGIQFLDPNRKGIEVKIQAKAQVYLCFLVQVSNTNSKTINTSNTAI